MNSFQADDPYFLQNVAICLGMALTIHCRQNGGDVAMVKVSKTFQKHYEASTLEWTCAPNSTIFKMIEQYKK